MWLIMKVRLIFQFCGLFSEHTLEIVMLFEGVGPGEVTTRYTKSQQCFLCYILPACELRVKWILI